MIETRQTMNKAQRLTVRRALINYIGDLDNEQLAGQNDADSIYTEEYTAEEIERAESMLHVEFAENVPKTCTLIVTVNGGQPFKILKQLPDTGDADRDLWSIKYLIHHTRCQYMSTPHDKVTVRLEDDHE